MEIQTGIRPDNLDDLDAWAHKLAQPLLQRLRQIDQVGDRLLLELSSTRSRWAQDVAYYIEKSKHLEEEVALLSERVGELVPRPKEHQHDPDEPRPVLVFDLDGTLKPQIHSGDGGNYPMSGDSAQPFPGVKEWLDRWKSRGCCLHIATAGLYYGSPEDIEVYSARLRMIESWVAENGLPIDLAISKVPSDCYYDDRMIE